MGKPPQMMAARPYMMFRVARVTMKEGMPNLWRDQAWNTPSSMPTATAATTPMRAPSSSGTPATAFRVLATQATMTALRATWEPTDRSISPAIMTRHMP